MINIDYLVKLAEDNKYKYKDYQQRVIDKIADPNGQHGLIAFHSMGSGKTLTALGAFDKVLQSAPKEARGLYIVPASLVNRTPEEFSKYNLDNLRNKVDVMSYEAASKLSDKLLKKKYQLVAVDEAHRLRNASSLRAQNIQKILNSSNKALLLTGTAGYNHPADILALVNRINPKLHLPEDHTKFQERYVDNNTWELKHKHELSKVLNTYIDKYEVPVNNEHFPTVNKKVVHVEMTPKQQELYAYLERKLPALLAYKVKNDLPITMQEASQLNTFSQGIRQASNSPTRYNTSTKFTDSPKIMTALKSLESYKKKTPGFRGVIYSNYLDSGIVPYEKALKSRGIKPLIYTGETTKKDKDNIVKEYNKKDNKAKVLILSSSGSEGLDLKRTNLMQILEPHFNESKINQAAARAIRYDSHADLPLNKRIVNVEEYRSVFPRTKIEQMLNEPPRPAIDDKLAELAQKKQYVVNQMTDLIGKPIPPKTLMEEIFG